MVVTKWLPISMHVTNWSDLISNTQISIFILLMKGILKKILLVFWKYNFFCNRETGTEIGEVIGCTYVAMVKIEVGLLYINNPFSTKPLLAETPYPYYNWFSSLN